MKLIQKQFLKGSREFEIVGDAINVRIRSLLKEEKISVVLTILNPEPIVNKPFLDFHSRVQCGPLLSLLIDKPNAKEFNIFVNELKRRARDEYNAFAGLRTGSTSERLPGNVYEEPPEFGEPENNRAKKTTKSVSVARVEEAIQMLNQHLDAEDIQPLLTALQSLGEHPKSESRFAQLVKAFDDLGPRQGAVLTYAPYVSILLSDDPFGF